MFEPSSLGLLLWLVFLLIGKHLLNISQVKTEAHGVNLPKSTQMLNGRIGLSVPPTEHQAGMLGPQRSVPKSSASPEGSCHPQSGPQAPSPTISMRDSTAWRVTQQRPLDASPSWMISPLWLQVSYSSWLKYSGGDIGWGGHILSS